MLPHWVAVIPQVPPLSKVTVFAETVQTEGVVEAKMTGKPDEAVALRVNGAEPKVEAGRAEKVMVCASALTVKLCCTCGAAVKLALPHWFAVIAQVPPLSKVTVFAETVQTAGVEEAKMTGKPDEAVALKLNGAEP